MCNCVNELNKQLEERKTEIVQRIHFDQKTGDLKLSPPVIATKWVDKKPREKSLPVLIATFCPFCGEKYD